MVRLSGRFLHFRRFFFFIAVLAGLWLVAHSASGREAGFNKSFAYRQVVATAFRPFGFLWSPQFSNCERIALFAVAGIAILALLHAAYLMRFVSRADRGTARMQDIARAIREGAQAYLGRQRNTLLPIIAIIALLLLITANITATVLRMCCWASHLAER